MLSELFLQTSGGAKALSFPETPPLNYLDSDSPYMKNFNTPFTGINNNDKSNSIMNANATIVPTRDDSYRDSSSFHDYRLGHGIGISKAFKKSDSLLAHSGINPIMGRIVPNKNFGRSDKTVDLNNARNVHTERAILTTPFLGTKSNENPEHSYVQPWNWNDRTNKDGSAYQSSVRSHHPVPDADAIHRRIYQPAPSRLTKMLSTTTELESMMPQKTLMHPMKYVTEDRQRMKHQRPSKNHDVTEAVIYENIHPRGMKAIVEAPRIYGESSVLRQPVGSSDTGDKSVFDRFNTPHDTTGGGALLSETNEDRMLTAKTDFKYVRGYNLKREVEDFVKGNEYLDDQYNSNSNVKRSMLEGGQFPLDQSFNGPINLAPNWP